MEFVHKNVKVKILKHGSVVVAGSSTLVLDPATKDSIKINDIINSKYKTQDIHVLVTHSHKTGWLKRESNLSKISTVFLGGKTGKMLEMLIVQTKRTIRPGEVHFLGDIRIQTLPAYNTAKKGFDAKSFHPRENQNVGYLIRIDDVTIYYTGHTNKLPEMVKAEGVDIFIPCALANGSLSQDEVFAVAEVIAPSAAILPVAKYDKMDTWER